MKTPSVVKSWYFIAIALTLVGCANVKTYAVSQPANPVVAVEALTTTAMIPVATQPDRVAEQKPEVTTDKVVEVDKERERQIECLAKNIYFEARGESRAGQMAVGQVTINRAKHDAYPPSICAVVKQRHQFSWYWDGVADTIRQKDVYADIHALAVRLYDKYWTTRDMPDIVNGATHFHTRGVNPRWKNMKLVARIDNHLFFRMVR